MTMNHTPVVLMSALAIIIANLAYWSPRLEDEPRLLVVTNHVWRTPSPPAERIFYVTNTVTTIREVPSPSQPYYAVPLPWTPSIPAWTNSPTDTNFWRRMVEAVDYGGVFTNSSAITNLNVSTNYIRGESTLTVLVSTNFDAGWIRIPTNWLTPEGLRAMGGAR